MGLWLAKTRVCPYITEMFLIGSTIIIIHHHHYHDRIINATVCSRYSGQEEITQRDHYPKCTEIQPRYPLQIPITTYYLETGAFHLCSIGKVGLEPGMRPLWISLISLYRTVVDQPNLQKCSRKHFEGILC